MMIFGSYRANNRSRMLGPFFCSMNVVRSRIYRARGGKEAGYPKRVHEYDAKILSHTNLTKYCEKPRRQTTQLYVTREGREMESSRFIRFKSSK